MYSMLGFYIPSVHFAFGMRMVSRREASVVRKLYLVALRTLYNRLGNVSIDCVVTGSLGMALQGMRAEFRPKIIRPQWQLGGTASPLTLSLARLLMGEVLS